MSNMFLTPGLQECLKCIGQETETMNEPASILSPHGPKFPFRTKMDILLQVGSPVKLVIWDAFPLDTMSERLQE